MIFFSVLERIFYLPQIEFFSGSPITEWSYHMKKYREHRIKTHRKWPKYDIEKVPIWKWPEDCASKSIYLRTRAPTTLQSGHFFIKVKTLKY